MNSTEGSQEDLRCCSSYVSPFERENVCAIAEREHVREGKDVKGHFLYSGFMSLTAGELLYRDI